MEKSEIGIHQEAKELLNELLMPLGTVKWESHPLIEDWRPDYRVKLSIGARQYHLLLEIKSSGEPRFIQQLLGITSTLGKRQGYPVFIAPFVSERGRISCIDNGVGYLDLSGNAYLRFGTVLIDQRGKDNRWKDNRSLKALFTPATALVLRRMFSQPNHAWKMVELSNATQISLGQISKIINRFADEGLMDKQKGNIKLAKPGAVLDLWRNIYHFENNETKGYYCILNERKLILERLRTAKDLAYALTLGSAASLVAPSVRSTDVHMYMNGKDDEIIELLELKSVEFGGNVYLIEPRNRGILHDTQIIDGLRLVSNLQLYLDLYNYPARGREQAEAVREQLLKV